MEDLTQIPHHSSWRSITPIEKGWSNDKKYRIIDTAGKPFLLRTSDAKDRQRKSEEFRMMTEFAKTGVNMSMPLASGSFDNNRRVYTLLTWVEGVEAEDYLKGVSNAQQYKLGYAAGAALRQLHTLPAPADWAQLYNKKIDTKLANYHTCPIKVPGEKQFIDFIEQNRSLIETREQTYQHGDFHIGNLIVTHQSSIGIIDFNRADFGDPWEEFNRIIFCVGASHSFATGRIDGYFSRKVPDDFFRFIALYIAVNAIAAITWALPFGKSDLDNMLKHVQSVLCFYDNFKTVIPSWYTTDH